MQENGTNTPDLAGFLTNEGVTQCPAVPTGWLTLLQHMDRNPGSCDLSHIRGLGTGGQASQKRQYAASTRISGYRSSDRFTADGWPHTGDIVTMDQHGHPAIHDRTRDSITSGGESISSIALENALMAHPTWVERPVAIVAFKEGSSATEQELRDPVVPQFARWWLPAVFVFVPEIPKTSTGKFLKSALREQHPDLLTKRGDSGRSVAD